MNKQQPGRKQSQATREQINRIFNKCTIHWAYEETYQHEKQGSNKGTINRIFDRCAIDEKVDKQMYKQNKKM